MQRLRVILTIVWIGFIFYQGTRPGEISNESSDKIVNLLVEIIEQVKENMSEEEISESIAEEAEVTEPSKVEGETQQKTYQMVSYIVRKSAHMLEYGVLGAVMFWTFKGYSMSWLNQVIYALFSVLLVALFDEYAQSFVARTSSVSDVILDFSSGIGGLVIFSFLYRMKDKKRLLA